MVQILLNEKGFANVEYLNPRNNKHRSDWKYFPLTITFGGDARENSNHHLTSYYQYFQMIPIHHFGSPKRQSY